MNGLKESLQENISNQQKSLSQKTRVFADFHNADVQGRLRLNCIGTIEDLAYQNIELKVEQKLTFYSEDLEVDGVVEYSELENIWVAVIDWDEIREIEDFIDITTQNNSLSPLQVATTC